MIEKDWKCFFDMLNEHIISDVTDETAENGVRLTDFELTAEICEKIGTFIEAVESLHEDELLVKVKERLDTVGKSELHE